MKMKFAIKKTPLIISILFLLATSCSLEKSKTPKLEFKTTKFSDQVHLFDNDNYPSCDVDLRILTPKDTAYYDQLRSKILQLYFDTLYHPNAQLDDLLFKTAQKFFADFKKQQEFLMEEDTIDLGFSLNWQVIIQNDIVYQDDHFISYMNEEYVYAGGAHGNTNRSYFVYDLERDKLLTASDLFKPEKCKDLIALQKQSLEKMSEDMSVFWIENLKCDNNFYLVENGIVLHYDPYEIASYAAGPINIFISFEDINAFLQQPQLFKDLMKE